MGCGQSTNSILEPKGRKIIMMGAVGSGKTSVMYQLTKKMTVPAIPTVGHNAEFLSLGKEKYVLYDIGARNLDFGQVTHLLESAVALVFMIDAANPNATIIKESVELFTQCVKHPLLQGLPTAICLNKQDLTNDIYIDQDILSKTFPLQLISGHNFEVFKISYKTKLNIDQPFQWLASQKLKAAPVPKKQPQNSNNNPKRNQPGSSYGVQQPSTDNYPPNSNNVHETQQA